MRAMLGPWAWWAMGREQPSSLDPGRVTSPGDERERFCRRVTLIASEAAKAARARLTEVDWTDANATTAALAVHAVSLERQYGAMLAQWVLGDGFAGG